MSLELSWLSVFAIYDEFVLYSQMWQFAPNSIYYLLSLWQRMVMSIPYVKATEPHMLETYTPEVSQASVLRGSLRRLL